MKPMIKYRGGKSKEIPFLIQHIPKINGRYIEPFLGGGAMYFYLEPQHSIINDINTKLMDFYSGIRDNYAVVREELDNIEAIYTNNRQAFEELKRQHPDDRVEDANEALYYNIRNMYNGLIESQYQPATLYYFINKTSYSGMIRFNARGEFNVPYGRYKNFNTQIITERHQQLLAKAEIHNEDYRVIFDMANDDDFIFLDPPYDCIFSDYGNNEYRDGFGENNHRQLAQDFRNLGCPSLMVIGATPLTRELYYGLIIGEYQKNYAVNIRNRFNAGAMHLIITNYGH